MSLWFEGDSVYMHRHKGSHAIWQSPTYNYMRLWSTLNGLVCVAFLSHSRINRGHTR